MALVVVGLATAVLAFEVEPWYKNLAHFGPLDREIDSGKAYLFSSEQMLHADLSTRAQDGNHARCLWLKIILSESTISPGHLATPLCLSRRHPNLIHPWAS